MICMPITFSCEVFLVELHLFLLLLGLQVEDGHQQELDQVEVQPIYLSTRHSCSQTLCKDQDIASGPKQQHFHLKQRMHTHTHKHLEYKTHYFDGLVQERCNSSALAMELCLACTNPSIYAHEKSNCFKLILNYSLDMAFTAKHTKAFLLAYTCLVALYTKLFI